MKVPFLTRRDIFDAFMDQYLEHEGFKIIEWTL